jgi:hypothetical protein
MNKQTMMVVAITAIVVLIAANKLRSLPIVSKLPTI